MKRTALLLCALVTTTMGCTYFNSDQAPADPVPAVTTPTAPTADGIVRRAVGPQHVAVVLDDALPADVHQRPEHEHRLLEALGTDERREVVVELRLDLGAEVQELQLADAAEIAHGHAGVHQRHALMLEQFGVHAPEGGLLEPAHDEAHRVPARRQEHLAAGLIGLWLDRRADVVVHTLRADRLRHVV